MDGHKDLDDKIYFRYEEGQGWYWCGRFLRSNTYSTYDDCLKDYMNWSKDVASTLAIQWG